MQVGAKRIWANRILEKKPDGKWHVVGHVAGLEGEAVPRKGAEQVPLDIRSLTQDQVKFLIRSLQDAEKRGSTDQKEKHTAAKEKKDAVSK